MKSRFNHLSTKETQLPSLASSSPGASASECDLSLGNTSVLILEPFRRKFDLELVSLTPKGSM